MASRRSRGQSLITLRLCRSRYQISMVVRRSITSTKIYDIIDTENRVKFHVNRMKDNLLVDDINVKPGTKTVKFDFGDIRFMVVIALEKSFPDIDTLII